MSLLALNSTVDVFVSTYIFDALCQRRLQELNGSRDANDAENPVEKVPSVVYAELQAIATLWTRSHDEVPSEFVGILLAELIKAWVVLGEVVDP